MRWEFYKDIKGRWWWRKVNSAGKIIIKSKEGHVYKTDCVRNAIWKGYTP